MKLSTQQQLQLDNLLLQREAAYTRVYTAESEINTILGEEYPFPEPDVPIATATNRKKKTARKKANAAKATAPKLRALEDDESAYRVQVRQDNGTIEETHVDRKSLQALLQDELSVRAVRWIETLDADGEPRERLYEAES